MDSPVDGRTLRYRHRKPELLSAATEYLLEHGVSETSLRDIAAGLGVTHATLLRHFTSKDDLIHAVLDAIRADFVALMAHDEELPASDLFAAFWQRLCDPRHQRQFVLLFELVALKARGHYPVADVAQSLVDDWLRILKAKLSDSGWPAQEAVTLATVALAQVRGLQLDLLMTGDRPRVDRAVTQTLEMITRKTS